MGLELGSVDTIYEAEEEGDQGEGEGEGGSSSLPPRHPSSSGSSLLPPTVRSWSRARGRNPDVLIYVAGLPFHLHKEPLISRSNYLKRLLMMDSEITLSPPLNITIATFTVIAEFCYGGNNLLTTNNVASLRIAAELLEMTELNDTGGDNLRQITEAYFREAVARGPSYSSGILRSSLPLLPEAEEVASVPSRCIEALSTEVTIEDAGERLEDALVVLSPEEFQIITDSMHCRFDRSHDLLYEIIDIYFRERQWELTEEQRILICNSIDCDKLSLEFLLHAVKNPAMPLRFVVRAMLIEQLHTCHSIASSSEADSARGLQKSRPSTLGAIIQRDAALRQVAQLKTTMDRTYSHIRSLEEDIEGMRKLLHESEGRLKMAMRPGRSESFRVMSTTKKVERGQRGSVSLESQSLESAVAAEIGGAESSVPVSCVNERTPKSEKMLGRRLLDGLKSAFWRSSSLKREKGIKNAGRMNEIKEGKVVIIDKEDGEPNCN